MMEESRELRTMRQMAWSRAKGELDSMLATHWSGDDKYRDMKAYMDEFISAVEIMGLQE